MAPPILSRTDLPELGSERERPDVDAKRDLDETKHGVLANDVAAFANASGGNILVGAHTEGSTFHSYPGITPERAEAIGRAFEEAARNNCRPAPFLSTHIIPVGDSKVVLAVFIGASASGPVGVKLAAPGNERRAADAWFFPHRVGSHTRCASPDQFATFEPMGSRRSFALLRTIPASEWGLIDVFARNSSVSSPERGAAPFAAKKAKLSGIDEGRNVVWFELAGQYMGTPRQYPFTVPGDWIETVWRDPASERWQVALTCDIKTTERVAYGVPRE